jgi:4-carboxymuconolactone decarboxylase
MYRKTFFRQMILVGVAVAAVTSNALAQNRLPEITPEKFNAAQKAAVEQMKGPFPVGGPFAAMLRDPKFDVLAYQMATYYRNESVLGVKLTEMVIMLVARDWTQQFEWEAHYTRATQAGLKVDTVKAISDGRRPVGMAEDEEIVYDFCMELNRNKSVSDATYGRALKKFGDQGVMALTGINGYYTLLAMILNVAQWPVPSPQNPPLPALPR